MGSSNSRNAMRAIRIFFMLLVTGYLIQIPAAVPDADALMQRIETELTSGKKADPDEVPTNSETFRDTVNEFKKTQKSLEPEAAAEQ